MKFYSWILCLVVLSSCIKDDLVDDFVEPEIRITKSVDSLAVDSTFQSTVLYFNNVGEQEVVEVVWSSSDENVASVVASTGLIKGIGDGGCSIYASYAGGEIEKTDSFTLGISAKVVTVVDTSTTGTGNGGTGTTSIEKNGTVATTSSYPLNGNYTLKEQGSDLLLSLDASYSADNSLPGLYIYLSNNNSSTAAALEIAAVTVFSGAHSYLIPNTGINDFSYILYFCKPFNVKVGEGVIPSN